jgi:hypothetical protein
MLPDDGSMVQVYHAAEGLSKRPFGHRNEGSALERENGDLAVTRCGKQVTTTAAALLADSALAMRADSTAQ